MEGGTATEPAPAKSRVRRRRSATGPAADSRFAGRFLLPGGLWLAAFFLVPLGLVLALSVGQVDDLGGAVYAWNPSNYSDVFNATFLPILWRSVFYAAITVALCLLLGYPVAYYIARYGGKRKNLLVALLVLPFFVNYLVRTYGWYAILADDGFVNGLLADLGRSEPVQFLNTPGAVIGGLVYGFIAFMVLPVYASLDRMDPSLIEAGKDLYGSPWQTFRHVTWPASFQGVLAGSVLVFLPAVGDFVSAQILGGPQTYMVGNLIQQQFGSAENWPFGAALTTVLMLFLMVWMIFYLRSAAKAAREPATA
jgi:spermidine/putrescine transport system permease protein